MFSLATETDEWVLKICLFHGFFGRKAFKNTLSSILGIVSSDHSLFMVLSNFYFCLYQAFKTFCLIHTLSKSFPQMGLEALIVRGHLRFHGLQ